MIKTYPINEELAGVVPMPTQAEQDALTADIAKKGLITPIVLWHGEIVDGRCRQIACTETGTEITAKELDWDMSENDVREIVKSLNIRRNLTMTQKATTAFKVYLKDKGTRKLLETGAEWGVSPRTMKAINYIYKQNPLLLEPLFNGDSVQIKDAKGNWVASNKINSICQHLKRVEEESRLRTTASENHEWVEDAYIKTQAGKDWYYSMVSKVSDPLRMKMALAELANYKFADIELKPAIQSNDKCLFSGGQYPMSQVLGLACSCPKCTRINRGDK